MGRTRNIYYDRQGNPISREEWAEAVNLDNFASRVVAKTRLRGGVIVSTVWVGLNLNYREGPPLIFETMVFGDGYDDLSRRYATEAEAEAGHQEVVDEVHTR